MNDEITFELRIQNANLELNEILEKYKLSITAELRYMPSGIAPQVRFVDNSPKETIMSEDTTEVTPEATVEESTESEQVTNETAGTVTESEESTLS